MITRWRFGQNHQKVRKLLLAWQCGDAFSYILAFEQTERWSSDLNIEWTNHFRYKAFKKPVLLWLIRFSNIHCMFRRKVQGEIQVKLAKPINQHRDINVRSIKSGTFELARFFHFQNMNILKWLTLEATDNSRYFFLPVEYGLIYSRDYFVRFICRRATKTLSCCALFKLRSIKTVDDVRTRKMLVYLVHKCSILSVLISTL